MRNWFNRVADRRTVICLTAATLVFIIGLKNQAVDTEVINALAMMAIALGGTNAAQKSAIAFARRGQAQPAHKKEEKHDAISKEVK